MLTQTSVKCSHCGTPFRPSTAEEEFCCHGCRYVSQLIHEGGLERFYELRGTDTLPPIGSKVFQSRETDWLRELQDQAEADSDGGPIRCRIGIEGISCIACVWLIEAIFKQQSGAGDVHIDPRAGRIRVNWHQGSFSLEQLAKELQRIGYRLVPESTLASKPGVSSELANRIGLCAFFLLNTMLFTLPGYLGMGGNFFLAPLFQLLGAGFATMSLIVGGGYFIQRAWQAIRQKVVHIDLPIAIGLVSAYTGSLVGWASGYLNLVYFDFVATFVFLMLVGRWLQEFALERNRSHMQRQDFSPQSVTQVGGAKDGQTVEVGKVESGLTYSVQPGAVNPVAADLLDDSAHLSLEWINGEAEPLEWTREKIVPAGSINVGLNSVAFRAREAWSNSLLAQLLERPEDKFEDPRFQKILKVYILAILAIGVTGSAVWALTTGDLLKSLQVLISVLIVSCPCALGVALPMCDELAIARLRRLGLFIKANDIWERLRRVKTVVFDKTGTLTMEVPKLKNHEMIRDLDPLATEALFALVQNNPHPVARSLHQNLLIYHSNLTSSDQSVVETIGQGVSWSDPAGNQWKLGKSLRSQRSTLLEQNGLNVAAFDFDEDVRDDAAEAITAFEKRNLDTAILSGDAKARVDSIASQLPIKPEAIRAECSPQDKAKWIRDHAPDSALMIGDGANDSLAFDQAICRGTPVVDRSILESSADFFFFGRSLSALPELFITATKRRRSAQTVFAIALVYNLVAVGISLAGMMHPLLAAILMPLSSIVTLLIAWLGLKS